MAFPTMRSLEASQNAGPIALVLAMGVLHRSLLMTGLTLRCSLLTTDNVTMLLLLAIVTLWTALSSEIFNIPWIALSFGYFWLMTFLYSRLCASSEHPSQSRIPVLWRMNCVNGPFGWRVSVSPYWLYTLYATMTVAQVPSSLMLIYRDHTVQGVLSFAGLYLFFSAGLPRNKYVASKHRHAGDNLRVALPTSHIEGTIYILPSRCLGFQAMWSPKIQAEHVHTDERIMGLFARMRSGSYALSEPLGRLRAAMSAFNEGAALTSVQVTDLAEWLLMDPASKISETPNHFLRPLNIHLVGRDLMYALAHAEYLVFMRKDRLPQNLQKRLGKLRETKRSGGLDDTDAVPMIGHQKGITGYQQAVRYIYELFAEMLDPAALSPQLTLLHHSVALGRRIESSEDYVGSLWNICLEHSESTFSTLYMFCCIWFIEVGNVAGFHIFPVRCKTKNGDATAWSIIWRQGWYEAMVAQLIASSPMIAVGFIAGLF